MKNFYAYNNNNEFIYLPRGVNQIINIEKKYLIFDDNSNNSKLLYSIENNKILCSCEGIYKLIRINDYNFIGLNKEKELVKIEIKINLSDNYDIFPVCKYENMEIVDFDVLSNDKLVIIDKLNNINIMQKSNDNYFIYKSTKTEIKDGYINENIFVDKKNHIFAICFLFNNSLFNYFYDFDLNLRKFFIINKASNIK